MAVALKFKFQTVDIKYTPSDKQVDIIGYLVDTSNLPFTTAIGVDTFTVTVQKSSMPASGYEQYLTHIINGYIRDKYTVAVTGLVQTNSKIVSGVNSTTAIVPGQSIIHSSLPDGTFVESVRDQSSFRLSAFPNAGGTFSLTVGIKNWSIDFSEIATIAGIVNFVAL